ncbi:FxsA family protein [Paenibacillus xerothermodurans]|uniref:Membrane protein FxsA n=1 Tax=Paenibacillus xerothermodurans TaxID=1977292 RepID=A0A2W1NS66_PAEXE|nr:FxsA family protein [Paenibacillus xerothermodurans]PZE21633.1 membrane protein FxsA [Paenibacillus xerothermodurans]
MFRWLLALFIIVPALEIWGLIAAGRWIGGWQTVVLIIVIAVLGAYFSKREATRVWNQASRQLSRGEMPAGTILDGLCVLVGGIMLLFPGFFTDIIGLFFLLPFTRPLAKRGILYVLRKQIAKGGIRVFRRW